MNKLVCIYLAILFNFSIAYSQSRLSFTFSQSLVDDWKMDKAQIFEINHSLNYRKDFSFDSVLSIPKMLFIPTLRYAIGVQYTNLTSQNTDYVMPTDNEIFAEGLLKYPAGWIVDPFVSANFRSQITESFSITRGTKRATAKLWDPVISMQSLGFAHSLSDSQRRNVFTNRIGITLKQIRSEHYTLMTDNPKTPEKERYKADAGIEWKAEFSLKSDNNLSYLSNAEIFYSINRVEESTFRMSNELQVTIWKAIALIIRLELMFDRRQKLGVQYRQQLRAGMVLNL